MLTTKRKVSALNAKRRAVASKNSAMGEANILRPLQKNQAPKVIKKFFISMLKTLHILIRELF